MIPRLARALVGSALLVILLVPASLAYDGEVESQVEVAGPSRAVCPTAISATVTVVDRDGKPIAGTAVTWSNGASGTTDANGQHTTTVNVTADLTVTATAGGAVGSLVISCIQGEVLGSTGLPRTDTAPDPSWPVLLVVVGLAGAGVHARRRALSSR